MRKSVLSKCTCVTRECECACEGGTCADVMRLQSKEYTTYIVRHVLLWQRSVLGYNLYVTFTSHETSYCQSSLHSTLPPSIYILVCRSPPYALFRIYCTTSPALSSHGLTATSSTNAPQCSTCNTQYCDNNLMPMSCALRSICATQNTN